MSLTYPKRCLPFLLLILCLNVGIAQDQIGVNPPSLKWSKMHTPAGNIIYPRGMDSTALNIAWRINSAYLLDTSEVLLNCKNKKITSILQNQSAIPEGFATTIPWRQEIYLTPPQNMFIGPTIWQDAVTNHEYRHVQQFMSYNKGWSNVYKTLMGNTGWLLSTVLNVPLWYREGDAVDIETRYTTAGRGTLPAFNMEYRTLRLNGIKYSYEKAMSASNFKSFVPNMYRSGYYMTRHLRKQYGDSIWANVLDESSKKLFYPFTRSLKKLTGEKTPILYNSTFKELDNLWSSTDTINNIIGHRISKQSNFFGKYRMPQVSSNGDLYVSYSSLKQIRSLYHLRKDSTLKKTKTIGVYTTDHENFTLEGNIIAWAEASFNPRYINKTFSIIKYKDLNSGKITQLSHRTKYFSPAPSKDGKSMAVIEYNEQTNCSLIIIELASKEISQTANYNNQFLSQPRWMNNKEIIMVSINKTGNQLVQFNIETKSWEVLLDALDINISNPMVYKNDVYFSSGLTGIENIYKINIDSKKTTQITNARFGAFDPFVFNDVLYFSNYDLNGYEIWETPLNKTLNRSVKFPSQYIFKSQPNYYQDSVQSIIASNISIDTVYNKYFWNKLFYSTGWFPLIFPPELGIEFYTLNMERSFKSTMGINYNLNENIIQTKFIGSYAKLFPIINGGFTIQARNINQSLTVYDIDSIIVGGSQESIFNAGLALPLKLTQGVYHTNLNIETNYSYHILKDLSNPLVDYKLNTINLSTSFSRIRPIAKRQVKTPFGQVIQAHYKSGIDNTKPKQIFANAQLFFPGIFNTHSINFRGTFEANYNTNNYRYLSIFKTSRGYQYYPFDNSILLSANYELPIFYPDLYIRALAGISRVRMNVFYDYTQNTINGINVPQRSFGSELIFDIRLFRAFNMDLKLQFIQTQDYNNKPQSFIFGIVVNYFELLN